MRIALFLLLSICISCNQPASTKQDAVPVPGTVVTTVQLEDSLTIQLRTAVTAIEKKELELTSSIKWMLIENIQHEMISLKDFYTIKKEELAKEMKYSTDKEKTGKALAYLDKMITSSSGAPDVFKVAFHMNAALANSTVYNEQHTKFLKKDFSEITIIFP